MRNIYSLAKNSVMEKVIEEIHYPEDKIGTLEFTQNIKGENMLLSD